MKKLCRNLKRIWCNPRKFLKKIMKSENNNFLQTPFKDVPVKGLFYLEPTESAQICIKLDNDRYSYAGIIYTCAREQIVYVKR